MLLLTYADEVILLLSCVYYVGPFSWPTHLSPYCICFALKPIRYTLWDESHIVPAHHRELWRYSCNVLSFIALLFVLKAKSLEVIL